MNRRSLAIAASLAGCLMAFGCGGTAGRPNGQGTRYAKGGTYTVAVNYDLGSFDPYSSNKIYSYNRIAYDSLVNQDPNGKFMSGLAEKWDVTPLKATFSLRQGITCSDGTPLTASQVAADLNYLGDPKNASPLYGLYIPKIPYTASADDASRTVTVALKKPYGLLLNTLGISPIVCANGMKNRKLLETGSAGTGPFVLTGVSPGQSWTFSVRKGYTWGPAGAGTNAPGTPTTLVLKVVTNETTAANLLLSGQVNYAQITGKDQQRLLARRLRTVDLSSPGAWIYYNQLGGRPTAEKQIRQALTGALDFDQLIKVSTGGAGRAETSLVHPRPLCPGDTVTGQLPRHDVAAAAALLDQAGWTKGADGFRQRNGKPLRLNLHYWPGQSPYYAPTAELLAQQWRALGVRVKISVDTIASFTNVIFKTGDWDVFLTNSAIAWPDGFLRFLTGPVPPQGTNWAGVHNKEYEQLAGEATRLLAPEACPHWIHAEQALFRNLDIVPVSQLNTHIFLNRATAALDLDIPIPTSLKLLS